MVKTRQHIPAAEHYFRRWSIGIGAWLFCLPLTAADIPPLPAPIDRNIDFVHDIQPILAARCYACHGPEKQENDLRWDSKASAMKGGISGPALVPGQSAESR